MNSRRIVVLFFLLAFISGFLNYFIPRKSAVIIDSISVDSEFRTKSVELLSKNGFRTSYFAGEEVTVEFFKNLPKNDLYIFRVHSTCINNRTWIFTGEEYSSEKYPILQLTDLIHRAKPSLDSEYLFSVSTEFIRQYNRDGFDGGVILMMGCEGLCTEDLAKAFCDEGAIAYISWDGYVCLEHTDQSFLTLLEALYSRNLSISESLVYTWNQSGGDPVYSSSLNFYPPDGGYRKVS